MLKKYDTSQLTRIARARCRPLSFLQRLITTTAHRHGSAKISASFSKYDKEKLESTTNFGAKSHQSLDYQPALEMSRAIDPGTNRSLRQPRKRNVPSIRDLDSFRRVSRAASTSTSHSHTGRREGKKQEDDPDPDPGPYLGPNVETSEATDGDVLVESSDGTRRNAVGVQMLSRSLHTQLFPGPSLPAPPQSLLEISKRHLNDNGLSPAGAAVLPEISIDLPPLRGANIREHFYALGKYTGEPWATMARDFARAELPQKPTSWIVDRPGWTKYHSDGRSEAVQDLGDETLVSFDVEVLYKLSKYPCMATAVTPNAWYSWLSPTIFETPPAEYPDKKLPWETQVPIHPHELIPLFNPDSDIPRIVVGHNVGFDRARVKEEYSLKRTQTRWLDTLSLHVATRGITSVQRPAWMAHRKNKKAKDKDKAAPQQENLSVLPEIAEEFGDDAMMGNLLEWIATEAVEAESLQKRWEDVTSMNSLAEVASLHCGISVDKSVRDTFGDDSIKHASQLRDDLQVTLTYCANDVGITHQVYSKVFPLFLDSCPHPASLSGVLSMGNSFLPVDQSWREYLKNAEEKYLEMDAGVKKALRLLAERLRAAGPMVGEEDPWSSQLDWTPKSARWSELDGDDVEGSDSHLSTNYSPGESSAPEDGSTSAKSPEAAPTTPLPSWMVEISANHDALIDSFSQKYVLPLVLRLSYKSHPVVFLHEHAWCFMVSHDQGSDYIDQHGPPCKQSSRDTHLGNLKENYLFFRIGKEGSSKKLKLNGPGVKSLVSKGELTSPYPDLLQIVASKSNLSDVVGDIWQCVEDLQNMEGSLWGQQLDWTTSHGQSPSSNSSTSSRTSRKSKEPKVSHGTWPKWYWDLTGPANRISPGELHLTCKQAVAPLLLRLQWQGYPLIYSKEHKWCYRMPKNIWQEEDDGIKAGRGNRLMFSAKEGDDKFRNDADHVYFRLPHKDGEDHKVGSPLTKSFVKAIESGELASATTESGDDAAARAATDATHMNAFCSYWISSRERIMDQLVVYRDEAREHGMILPQVITMGTVTRRAVEATWLTASNAKKNRVGSELKAMVRAPEGHSIVGADVDSEELWISSVMGDSQFGMHGATAIGWMTLEGTKSAGTDLHSKTANILGISRDAAKVFNYSRIYGAGKKHAVQLLLQGDSRLNKDAAGKLADNLYKATKGSKAVRKKNLPPAAASSIWHGGSESYLFNTLEAIALSDRPTTPALGCGVTRALRKSYLGEGTSYLPSRINWVVQSSGVDYLHLLIVSMEYLIRKYNIQARYLISVHDEVRYLAKEEDRYRTAMALQIANVWTRALFCYNLGMDDMPQGIAFFSAVDVDHVLRKEVFLTCETPSHPSVIPAGQSLGISDLLDKIPGAQLGEAIPDDLQPPLDVKSPISLFPNLRLKNHIYFLEGQANKGGAAARHWLDQQPAVSIEPL